MLVMAWTWAGALPAAPATPVVSPGIAVLTPGVAVARAGVSAPVVPAAAVGSVVPMAEAPSAEFKASLKLLGVVPGTVSAVAPELLCAGAAAAAGSASCCCIATIWSIRPTTAELLILLWHRRPPAQLAPPPRASFPPLAAARGRERPFTRVRRE